jgi:hypothetical protein
MNYLQFENIYKNDNNYINTNYNSLIKLQKNILLLKPQLNIDNTFFINNNSIFKKNLYINSNNPYSEINDQYINIYGGIGIDGNLFLDGKLNINSDFNIDYTRKTAPLELSNILIHIGNSEINGTVRVMKDILINGNFIIHKNLRLYDDILEDDYKVEKNIYGNIYNIFDHIVTYNDIYTDIINNNNIKIITDKISSNIINANIVSSNTAVLNIIISNNTDLDNLNNIGNLILNGLDTINIQTINIDHGKIYCNNIISNGTIILTNDLYTNILNTPYIEGYNLTSNTLIVDYIYIKSIRFNKLNYEKPLFPKNIDANIVNISNSITTQELFTNYVNFNGNVYMNGLYNFINTDSFNIASTIVSLNKPAFDFGKKRDAGIFHIYNNETEVPAVIYKRDTQNNISPIKGLSDIVVFGNINIKDVTSGKPLSNIYFNNADVIGLHSVYMNSINGNIKGNLIIGEDSYNIYFGNTYFYGKTYINNFISNNIYINNQSYYTNLNANIIYGNSLILSYIKPISGNIIINKLTINNIYLLDIQANNITTSYLQSNILNLSINEIYNINCNIITTGIINSNILISNNIISNDININGNTIINGNIITTKLYVNDILSPTILIDSNIIIPINSQNIIFKNKNNSIFATLNNSYINDVKNFLLEEINAYSCYVITNNGTYYLNNSYSYLTLYFDGYKWFTLDSTPIVSTLNTKIIGTINSNLGKSISINYYGNILCAGAPDNDYGMFKYIYNNNTNWIESNIISAIPFTKFGNLLCMSGDSNIIVCYSDTIGNVHIYNNLNLVQDIYIRNKVSSIAVSYNGNVIVFGLNTIFGNIGCLQIYKYNGINWIYDDSILPKNHIGASSIGDSIDMSINGDIIVFGGSKDNNGIGKVWIYNEIVSGNTYIYYNINNNINTLFFDEDTGNLHIGGTFSNINSINSIGGSVIDTTSNITIKFGNVNGNINSIKKYNGNIYYAGNYTQIDNIYANSIACWNGLNWNRLGNGIIGNINTIAIAYDNIYIGGKFNNIDGKICSNIAFWNINTSTWNNISGGINGEIKNILYYNQSLYFGGNFTFANINGTLLSANNIVGYNIDTKTWFNIGSGVQGTVDKIYQYKNSIYVCGSFHMYDKYYGNFGKIIANNTYTDWISSNINIDTSLTDVSLTDISISETGQYQSYCYNGNIYTSSDYGKIWYNINLNKQFYCINISSFGKYQSAGENIINGNIYTSSDYGKTWIKRITGKWKNISISYDGKYQSAIDLPNNINGTIYTSSDFGITWISKITGNNWSDIGLSGDGQYQCVSSFGGYINISNNYGVTWNQRGIIQNWSSIAISESGQYISACSNMGNIYISSNYGDLWTSVAFNSNWNRIKMSASGKYQIINNGYLYFSNDYGFNWRQININLNYYDISKNSYYVTGGNTINIYTCYPKFNVWEYSGFQLDGTAYDIYGYNDTLLIGGLFTGGTINLTINITANISYTITNSILSDNLIFYNINNKSLNPSLFFINGIIKTIYYDDIMDRYYIGGNNLYYYHNKKSYEQEQFLVSNNFMNYSNQGAYIKYEDTNILIGSIIGNSFWKWTKYGDYWHDEIYNKSMNSTNFAITSNFRNIYTNNGNILIQNQNIGNDYFDDYNIMIKENGNIYSIDCNYNSSKVFIGINSNIYIYS